MYKIQYSEDGIVRCNVVEPTNKKPLLFDTKEEAKAWIEDSMICALYEYWYYVPVE